MKRSIISFILALAAIVAPVGVAVASPVLPTPSPTPTVAPSSQQADRLNVLKTHGGSEIDRRLDNLQKTAGKVAQSTQLAAGDKQKITDQLQNEITILVALKTRMSGETDLVATRQDVQGIMNEYSAYGLVYPKGLLMSTADRMMAAGAAYDLVRSSLQHKITTAKQAGKDVTKLQAALDDIRAKIADAKTRYQPLAATVLSLPKDYAAAHAVLVAQSASLKTARADLKQVHDDAQTIVDGLGNLKAATPTPSPSASVKP